MVLIVSSLISGSQGPSSPECALSKFNNGLMKSCLLAGTAFSYFEQKSIDFHFLTNFNKTLQI